MDDINESNTNDLDKESTHTKMYYGKETESDCNTMILKKLWYDNHSTMILPK